VTLLCLLVLVAYNPHADTRARIRVSANAVLIASALGAIQKLRHTERGGPRGYGRV